MAHAGPQQLLVLAPHPDDESFGCGGTIKLITSSGGRADVLYMTRGERGFEAGRGASRNDQEAMATARTAEALEACRILGVTEVAFLNGRDGHVHPDADLVSALSRVLEHHNYRSVFAPWPRDHHDDHKAAFSLLLAALHEYPREIQVWLYEVWSPLEPNMMISIDSVIEWKIRAMRAHASQMAIMDYVTAFRALAKYRSLFCPSSKFAEAFFTCDSVSLCGNPELPHMQRSVAAYA
jgi:N-acetylglucosamine malate deacetylase 1